PKAGSIEIPTFQAVPEDLDRSPQLKALVPRDTAGIDITVDPPALDDLPDAIAALGEIPDAPTMISGVRVFADSISFTYEDRGINGRSVNTTFRDGEQIYTSDPTFDDVDTF